MGGPSLSCSSQRVPDLDAVRSSLRANGEDASTLDSLVLTYIKVGKRGPKLFLFERSGPDGRITYLSALKISPERASSLVVDLNQRAVESDTAHTAHTAGHTAGHTDLADTADSARSVARRPVAYFDATLGLLFQPFPLDRRLGALAKANSGRQLKPRLERLLAASVDGVKLRAIRTEVLRYKPERKCTFRHHLEWERPEVGPAVVYGKLARESDFGRRSGLLEQIHTVANSTGFCLPVPFGDLPDWCMEFYSEVPGSTLVSLHADAGFVRYCEQAARCLHTFHGMPVVTGARSNLQAKLDQLAADAAGIAQLWPSEAETARQLSGRIGNGLREQDELDDACLHGDFHGSNVLVSDHRLGLIDLEDCVRGDPADDIGSMCAYLVLMALQHPAHASEIDRAQRAFVAAYPDSRNRAKRIAVHTALYCFFHVFQRLRHPHDPHHLQHARRLLATSRDALAGLLT